MFSNVFICAQKIDPYKPLDKMKMATFFSFERIEFVKFMDECVSDEKYEYEIYDAIVNFGCNSTQWWKMRRVVLAKSQGCAQEQLAYKLSSKLEHKNIVRPRGHLEIDNDTYFLYEYYEDVFLR